MNKISFVSVSVSVSVVVLVNFALSNCDIKNFRFKFKFEKTKMKFFDPVSKICDTNKIEIAHCPNEQNWMKSFVHNHFLPQHSINN